MKDLFGNELTVEQARSIELAGKKKRTITPRGYAYPPGTGPVGETCGTCKFAAGTGGYRKTFYKCEKLRRVWTRAPGTDIRLKSPACKVWERYVAPAECVKCGKALTRYGTKELMLHCKCWPSPHGGDRLYFLEIIDARVTFPNRVTVEVKQ